MTVENKLVRVVLLPARPDLRRRFSLPLYIVTRIPVMTSDGLYSLLDLADRVHQLRQSLKSEVFALHRDQYAVGTAQRVDCQKPERRRAVDHYHIVAVGDRREPYGGTPFRVRPCRSKIEFRSASEIVEEARTVVVLRLYHGAEPCLPADVAS